MTSLFDRQAMGSFRATGLGLGTARLGAFWQRRSVAEGAAAVRAALDLGVSLIDTADVYARGLSERIVARAVGQRQDVVVMTKVGLVKTPAGIARATAASGRVPSPAGLRAATSAATCFERHYVLSAARACLKRQRRDALDVLLLHEPSAADLRQGRFLDAIDQLLAAGDVVDFGASVRDEEAALAAMDLPQVRWLQIPANARRRDIAEAVSRHPRSGDVTTLALGVLGDGQLLRSDDHAGIPMTERVAGLTTAATQLPGIDGVLLGMSSPDHVVANLAALRRYESGQSVKTGAMA